MSLELDRLQPGLLWSYFRQLSRIPRPPRHEQGVRDWLRHIALRHGLEAAQDGVGNMLLRKPATPGMERRTPVVLQGHMDMVPQANSGSSHDFNRDPIELRLDGDWITANATTLGADNGIGISAMLAALTDPDLRHGPLEALFTCNEEDGMDGANGLEPATLRGRILINIDAEEEGELCIGCAGGANVSGRLDHALETLSGDWSTFRVALTGLHGGHSGLDIHRGRGNAITLLFRFLKRAMLAHGLRLGPLEAGSMRNAIPREAFADVAVPTAERVGFARTLDQWQALLRREFENSEAELRLHLKPLAHAPKQWMDASAQQRLTNLLLACPSGVIRMSETMPGLVETSTNLSIVHAADGQAKVHCLVRSSVDSARQAVVGSLGSLFELAGFSWDSNGEYPGWRPNPDSPVLAKVRETYQALFDQPARVGAIHAGLECGIIGASHPQLDMISFGPTIRSPHSPDERVQIPSVERFWRLLVAVLRDIPDHRPLEV